MDAKQALTEIIEAAKPMTVTATSRADFVQDCAKSGISIDSNLNVSGMVTEKNIDSLLDHLSSSVLKMVARRVLRSHL